MGCIICSGSSETRLCSNCYQRVKGLATAANDDFQKLVFLSILDGE